MAQAKREKAKPKPKPKFSDKAQSDRFIEAARSLDIERTDTFARTFTKVIRSTK